MPGEVLAFASQPESYPTREIEKGAYVHIKFVAGVLLIVSVATFIAQEPSGAGVSGRTSYGIVSSTNSKILADGGSSTTYTFANGVTMTSFVPPAGFSPLTASASQLAEYGFPPRPEHSSGLSNWNSAMSHATDPYVGTYDFSSQPLSVTDINQTTHSGGNYSGFDGTGSPGRYDGTQADFSIPTVTNTLLCTTPYFSMWTGLGGINSASLLQSGMIYNLGQVSNPNVSDWTGFYELLDSANPNNPPQNIVVKDGKSWHVNTADTMFSQTTYSSAAGGTVNFYLEDESTGQFAPAMMTGVSAYYDGTTADAIVEDQSNFPFKISPIYWIYVSVELSSGVWDPLLSVSQDKWIGFYSAPSTLSTNDNTSFQISSTYNCGS